ncbi:DUF6004 family protein [Mycobacterium sp.]|uniref:DUF6004 family protein n=1 Tax=Mycobacterium sp. TaxID=1785 RepID=UPI002C48635B|nr:DUF6004 family protein [Mycobacterium sp.]HTY35347.1 DUF6004 family protein [Mycobacterium sp.]
MSLNIRETTDRETYESLNIEPVPLQPHILAAATVVFGSDYYTGERETINLSGFVQMNKWPMPGFRHRVDQDGRAEFETELISAPEIGIKGYSYTLDDRIQVLSNPFKPNTGYVRQVVPGYNFPAHFHIRRFGILETTTTRMVHKDVISMQAVIEQIPPYKKPLSSPYLGTPRGDGPLVVVPATGVVAGQNLPQAWYPATDENEVIPDAEPAAFFAESTGPCMSFLVDPSAIMQITVEGKITIEIDGKTETVDVSGDFRKAAGAEILLFGPEKHKEGSGVFAQLARVAVTGYSSALGGRIMLRASWPRPSAGTVGDGTETSFGVLAFPADLNIDANFEIATPRGVLYADNSVHISGRLIDVQPTGTELRMHGVDTPLVTKDGTGTGRLTGVHLQLQEAIVGERATVAV